MSREANLLSAGSRSGSSHSGLKPKRRPMKARPRINTWGGFTCTAVPCSAAAIDMYMPERSPLSPLIFPAWIKRPTVCRNPWKVRAIRVMGEW